MPKAQYKQCADSTSYSMHPHFLIRIYTRRTVVHLCTPTICASATDTNVFVPHNLTARRRLIQTSLCTRNHTAHRRLTQTSLCTRNHTAHRRLTQASLYTRNLYKRTYIFIHIYISFLTSLISIIS